MEDLKNKVVVITGGAIGIGYEIANTFLTQDIKVLFLLDKNETYGIEATNNLNSKYGEGKVVFMQCDVTKDLEDISAKILKEHQVDVLVNNAGIVNESSARDVLEINCVAVTEWTMKFWEHMRKDKGGKGGVILNIGSVYSYLVDPYLVFYKTSKYAVMGLTRSLGHQQNYQQFGVRVLILCPGFTYTKLTGKKLCWDEHDEKFQEFVKTQEWQNADVVGSAALKILLKADSGTAWSIVGGKLEEYAP